jgi:hypothetical protein
MTEFTLNLRIWNSALKHTTRYCCSELVTAHYEPYNTQVVSGGIVNILGGGSKDYSE